MTSDFTETQSRGSFHAGPVSAPEPGQLVDVRRRQWIVAEIEKSATNGGHSKPQHYLTLSSIDEDSLGEQIEVVWEIEPGAHIIERKGLPTITGQDETEKLEAFLDAVRWGAATNADRNFLQAPFRSGISIEDFQLDPLVRAIDMARANLLIADDVGLGKTIEAGLVIQELFLRHRARTAFVVCPASLQEKWRVEMLEKFGLEFKIINTDYIKRLRRDRGIHANPWTSFPRIITSVDWLKSGDAFRTMRNVLPPRATYPRKFDILVVDEAHNIAPSGSPYYYVESQRTRLIRKISPHFQHRLFLTATPHNGYTYSFTSLLELLDDQRFSRNIMPDSKQLAQVMIRRLKTDLVDNDETPKFPKRNLKALLIPFTSKERAIHNTLKTYCNSRDKNCQNSSATYSMFINSMLKKRLFSSPAAFASTLHKHIETLTSDKRSKLPKPIEDRILQKAILRVNEEDYADDAEAETAMDEAVEEASIGTAPLTNEERKCLYEMRDWAQKSSHCVDSKANAILDWIKNNLMTDGGEWNNKRVILYTEYRTTLQWLQEILASHGYGSDRLGIIHGGLDHDERETIKAAFQANPNDSKMRILLATDAAAEGIDLQNYCNCLIHVEIPYNPNVMEQRNGRIDRLGQKHDEVLIWHPVDSDDDRQATIGGHKDDIIRALSKLEKMRKDMGSVNPVIEPQIAGLIEGSRSHFEIQEDDARIISARRLVGVERKLNERISRLHERLLETQNDFHLTSDRIFKAVKTGLALAGKPPLKPIEMKEAPSGTVFEVPALSGSWARCLEGLHHPYTHEQRPITFDHDVAKGRDDIVLVHLNHRLVLMCLQLMRAEVWAQNDVKKLHRVDIRTLPDSTLTSMSLAMISRLVIIGGTHHRLHEELTVSGGYFQAGKFTRGTSVTEINQWFNNASFFRVNETLLTNLAKEFENNEDAIFRAVQARSAERLRNLQNTLNNLKQKEIDNITTVLDELAFAIKKELETGKKPIQLDLYSDAERTQLSRDVEELEERLARFPNEKELEIKAIENRYQDFTEHTFPVAVVFFVPEAIAYQHNI